MATALFVLAILHTFLVKRFQHIALGYRDGSVGENLFHLLGEVEIVFGLWAALLLIALCFFVGPERAVAYVEGLNFSEPLFVFVIMAIAATRPVVFFAGRIISFVARLIPSRSEAGFYFASLVIGPLLGSLITEPAAMTVTALVLKARFFDREVSANFRYLTLAALFVNVSIGGVLTPFAAPPVLMVAGTWGWGISHMLTHFGWKAAIAVAGNAALTALILRKELTSLSLVRREVTEPRAATPFWLVPVHLAFLGFVVLTAHHPVIFVGLFLFFLGFSTITQEHQDELKLRESLLVAFFLAGLVVLGGFQTWWLRPLLASLNETPLFVGAAALTAFTDNAALTFLGAQVPGLSDALKYALVAGSVAGGGVTVIANAPNPVGFAMLRESFGAEGVSPFRLFLSALPATIIAMFCFWALPR